MTPTLQEIQEYFSKAKEIRCLRLNSAVNVANVKNYTYNEADKSWNGPAGVVCFWLNGTYAEITKKRCEKCKNCNCK